ncbi:MAG: hypothetical protein COB23_05110 [Methylophaga sp.]|nr:MAG: hypothetical protein COB23_05110 [Methylophaga sp.]
MEKNEKQQKIVEDVVASKVESEKAQPVKQTLLWLAIFVLLGLLAGLFWFIQQQQVDTVALIKRLDTVEQSNDLSQLKQSIATKAKTTVQLFETLNTIDKDLSNKIDQVAKAQQLTSNDVVYSWTLAEVDFLLQAANQSVLLVGDTENARTALVLADQRLKALADPRLYRLRSLIADEQLALAAVIRVDIEGLAIQLQSAIDTVDSLQILSGPELNTEQVDDSAENTTSVLPENWQSVLADAWQEVRSLVVIRHQQDGTAAVLVPEQRYFLYQNLQLKLETARAALLLGKETVFYASLASAEQWLQQYFVAEERDAMLVMVKALQAEKITKQLPDISASLIWLQQHGDQ